MGMRPHLTLVVGIKHDPSPPHHPEEIDWEQEAFEAIRLEYAPESDAAAYARMVLKSDTLDESWFSDGRETEQETICGFPMDQFANGSDVLYALMSAVLAPDKSGESGYIEVPRRDLNHMERIYLRSTAESAFYQRTVVEAAVADKRLFRYYDAVYFEPYYMVARAIFRAVNREIPAGQDLSLFLVWNWL